MRHEHTESEWSPRVDDDRVGVGRPRAVPRARTHRGTAVDGEGGSI